MNKPIVSVIVTTKNEEKNIITCLKSIKAQTYTSVEIIVVDNNSTDMTKKIAKRYTSKVFDKGPERSAQRNFGAKKAKGVYLLFLDADMRLSKNVVKECVDIIGQKKIGGVVIPEESYGVGFWAQCKKLERSFYIGDNSIEAARFYKKNIFEEIGGFDEHITGPEDWDLSQRVANAGTIGRINAMIFHNEGRLSLTKTMQKKYYYAKKLSVYKQKKDNRMHITEQLSIIQRYKIFFVHPVKLFKHPVLGIGMLCMKTCEFMAAGVGYFMSERRINKYTHYV